MTTAINNLTSPCSAPSTPLRFGRQAKQKEVDRVKEKMADVVPEEVLEQLSTKNTYLHRMFPIPVLGTFIQAVRGARLARKHQEKNEPFCFIMKQSRLFTKFRAYADRKVNEYRLADGKNPFLSARLDAKRIAYVY